MEISLQKLLSFDFFSASEVLAGERGLENLVTGVTVLDSPDAYKYLRGGDFVITTAYGILHDENIQREVVWKLAVNGASGLGLKLRFFNYQLPQVMRETADSCNLPIICIPDDYAYTDIYEFITANMISRVTGELKREEDVFKEFNESVYHDGMGGVLKTLYRWTGLVAAIIFDGHVYTYPENMLPGIFPTDKTRWRKKESTSDSNINKYCWEKDEVKLEWLSAEIKEQGQTQGNILLFKGGRDFFNDDYLLLGCAVSACAMEIQKITLLMREKRKHRTSFLKSFFTGKMSWDEALMHTKELNYDLPQEGITVIVGFGCDNVNSLDEQKMNFIDGVVTRKLGTKEIFGFLDNNIVMYLSNNENNLSLLNELYVELSKCLPGTEIMMGISRLAVFADVSKSYEEAKSAIHIGSCLNMDTKIYSFGNLGFYRLLKLPDIYEEMVKYYEDYLKPLNDHKNSIDLIDTLSCFIESSYNYRKTSEMLYVHPNTVRYRIGLIEKICRINLNYAYDRFNMELALKILPLLNNK